MAKIKTKIIAYTLFGVLILIVLVSGANWFARQQDAKRIMRVSSKLDLVNKDILKGDQNQALVHARAALAEDPDNFDAINAVASLVQENNPDEARRLYTHELNLMKEQNSLDEDEKNAIEYWAAARLAERAGQNNEAKKYFKKVVELADRSDDYEKNLKKQAQDALRMLK